MFIYFQIGKNYACLKASRKELAKCERGVECSEGEDV